MEKNKIFLPYKVQALNCEHCYLALLSFYLVLYNTPSRLFLREEQTLCSDL